MKKSLSDLCAEAPKTISDYFRWRADREKDLPALRILKRDCGDCAVLFGLYRSISDDLRKEPDGVRRAISERWFCHTRPDRACRGNWDNQGFGRGR